MVSFCFIHYISSIILSQPRTLLRGSASLVTLFLVVFFHVQGQVKIARQHRLYVLIKPCKQESKLSNLSEVLFRSRKKEVVERRKEKGFQFSLNFLCKL